MATERGRRAALVTGGSRGIGAATCRVLAADGWDVCIGYRNDAGAADAVAADCQAAGARTLTVAVDVAEEDQVNALFAQFDAHWPEPGSLGVLVNNAGIVANVSRVEDMDTALLARMFAVNITGSFLCAGRAVTRMSTRHGGSGGVIVNVSSAAARLGGSDQYVDYAASKGAIDTMTIGLAKEVAAEGIRVAAVRPGLIDTEIHASGGQPDRAERMAPLVPMQRVGRADEVARTIAWLCGEDASYVTGALIDVTGGR